MWFLILRNWKLGLAGIAVVSALVYVGAMKWQIHSLRGQLEEQVAETAKLRVEKANVEAAVQVQNESVRAWEAAAVKNAELRRKAEKRSNNLANKAARIQIPVAPVSENCSERDAWLRSELNKLLWKP